MWMLEIESIAETHLIKAVEVPELISYGDLLIPEGGDLLKVVFRLPTTNLEKKFADLASGTTKCKAALYMLSRSEEGGEVAVCGTWIFEGFKPVKLKLQSFDRDRPTGLVELLVSCSFISVRIV